jgi:putative membrane-bound dehydrogenase-like protein
MGVKRYCLLLIPLVAACTLAWAHGQSKTGDKDYSAELPRIAPKEPGDAIKTIHVPAGFHVELVAAEPLIRSPVAIDFDEDGRMFVAEFPEYNQIDHPKFKEHGCIKVLESTKRDWKYDKATVYAPDLDSPVAVACWDGGVFVGAVPNILYFKDTKGDGKADIKKTIYTGFAKDRAGEAMLNSFRWGLDNRFHISTSNAGGKVRKTDEPEGAAKEVRSQAFLFDPRTLKFELTTGGGQHGMTMDDWGNKFVCDNSNPCHMIMYDGRYVARNPYVQAPPVAVNIAEEARTTNLKRLSPMEPWRVLRTRLRVAGEVPGPVETGKPGGHFTGTTGVTVYRGDAYPEEYRGNVFVGEVANNLVYRAKLVPDGIGFIAKRADPPEREFLASSDNWFRPVQFANGPDGCLYVIDMYRELIETVVSIPPSIVKHLDPASGINRGRIWRIVPDGFSPRSMPMLSKATTAELVKLLEHRNGWHRDTASRLLYQRQDKQAVPPLEKMCAESGLPIARVHAGYALLGMNALKAGTMLHVASHDDPRVVEHGLRLKESFAKPGTVFSDMSPWMEHKTLRVRYQAAFTMPLFTQSEHISGLLADLAQRDGADPWMRLAILTSAKNQEGYFFESLIGRPKFRATQHGKLLLASLASQIGAGITVDSYEGFVSLQAFARGLDTLSTEEAGFGKELVKQLMTRLPAAARSKVEKAGKAGELFTQLLDAARKVAADEKQPAAERAAAARTLSLADFDRVQGVLGELLTFRQPEAVQRAALESLARFDQPKVPQVVLAAWPGFSPQVRATAAETLFARPAWITAFLDAVEKGKIKTGEIDPARISLLQASADPKLRERAEKLFAKAKLSKRADVVAAYQKALDLKGDTTRGKALFAKNCSACHRLEGVGEQIGAELGAIKERGNATILLAILDPNREVLPKFLAYRVVTDAGRIITGMITAETATSITLRRADATSETVLRVNIEELESTGMSFMPEGLEAQIDVQGMADLLVYLNSVK